MEKYFTKIDGLDMSQLKISDVGKYSVSKPADAIEINLIIQHYFPRKSDPIIITDATANNGGNTIRFALDFKYVNSVEISEDQFIILRNNVEAYHLKNVNLIHGDYLNVMKSLIQDVIFIDAPWGGPEYKTKPKVDLYLGKKNIITIVSEIIRDRLCSLCVLKVPMNYNFSHLFSKIPQMRFDIYPIHNYVLICIPECSVVR
jgi:hypothetical protein